MTLLPNKHVPIDRSLVGIGGLLLKHFQAGMTVSSLWDSVKDYPEVGSFKNFVLALDLLYAIGAADYRQGLLERIQ